MPRVEPVSAPRVQPAREARRVQARTASLSIQRRADEARNEATRRALEDQKRRPAAGPGANLDILA